MEAKGKKYPIVEHVDVLDIAHEGKAMGRSGDMVVFIDHAIPGDVVDVKVLKKRKNYLEASVVAFRQLSPLRVEPPCQHHSVCGGCKWQDMEYASQLRFKENEVREQLVRIGRLTLPGILPIIGSAETYYYRNKLEYTFSNNRWLTDEEVQHQETITDRTALGFHIPGRFDRVLDVEHCHLQPNPSNAIRLAARRYAREHQLSFFDLASHEGYLRTMVIRTTTTGQVMVVVSFYYEDIAERVKFLDFLADSFPEITSLMYVINPKPHDSFSDLNVHLYRGQPYLEEHMEQLKFLVGPKSFFQTHSRQALKLYQVVRQMAGLTGKERVYDLYTGIGTIALFLAAGAREVVGIEYVDEAVQDAARNAEYNRVSNASFYSGDMKDIFTFEFLARHGKPDVLVLDPPRAGVHPKVIEQILVARPDKIVYVSCNPATQARDLHLMQELYDITAVQPVDMFPQTHHVENVVRLDLKK